MIEKLAEAAGPEVMEQGKLFEFMKNKWDADGSGCFCGTEFGKMWGDLEIDVNSAVIYSHMDKDNNDCISDKEWTTTIGIIRKACPELTRIITTASPTKNGRPLLASSGRLAR